MIFWHTMVETMFSISLFTNAILFIPQIIKLYRTKAAQGFSLLTFVGFNIEQTFIALHGQINHDWLLMIGTGLSLITCGGVTSLIIYYRLKSRIANKMISGNKM